MRYVEIKVFAFVKKVKPFTFSINTGPIRASSFSYFCINKTEIEIY